MPVKTHTFRLDTYHISEEDRVDGTCDVPPWNYREMIIKSGDSFCALDTALHEAMHAEGIPDKYIHDKDGCSDTRRLAMFLWRLGWRKGK